MGIKGAQFQNSSVDTPKFTPPVQAKLNASGTLAPSTVERLATPSATRLLTSGDLGVCLIVDVGASGEVNINIPAGLTVGFAFTVCGVSGSGIINTLDAAEEIFYGVVSGQASPASETSVIITAQTTSRTFLLVDRGGSRRWIPIPDGSNIALPLLPAQAGDLTDIPVLQVGPMPPAEALLEVFQTDLLGTAGARWGYLTVTGSSPTYTDDVDAGIDYFVVKVTNTDASPANFSDMQISLAFAQQGNLIVNPIIGQSSPAPNMVNAGEHFWVYFSRVGGLYNGGVGPTPEAWSMAKDMPL